MTEREIDRADVMGILGVSVPNGVAQINSIRTGIVSCKTLYVTENIWLIGALQTPLNITNLYLSDGSMSSPSLAYSSDASTGMYYTGGGLGFTVGGIPRLTVDSTITINAPITTSGGQDLVLNPSGSNIDFTGHNIVNVGSIVTNPNRYEVVAPVTIITTTTADTIIYNIPTVINSSYIIITEIIATDVTSGTQSAGFSLMTKVNNISGVVTVLQPSTNITKIIDVPLAGMLVRYATSGSNVTLVANGLAGITIKWFGASSVTRQLF
jgi:hypothetical protein